MITKSTLPTHVWTLPKTNACIDLGQLKSPAKAMIMAISREYGIEYLEVFEKSINKCKFKVFLENLR